MLKPSNSIEKTLDYAKENSVEFIDLRFIDLPGAMQHFNIPLNEFIDSNAKDGVLFDASSIRGFSEINESDMKLIPDPSTAYIDPFRTHKTIIMNCTVYNPKTNEKYIRDPRNIAIMAQEFVKTTGFADTAYFAPEAEFYLFDDVRFSVDSHSAFYSLDSIEGAWNSGRAEKEGNLAYKPSNKGGYLAVPPSDHFVDLRDTMASNLEKVGIKVERSHHEVGSAAQQEISIGYDELLKSADDLMKFKYIIKNTALEAGKSVTFLPKPIYGDNGSGMHCHQSLWKNGKPIFYGKDGYALLSDNARWYIGGLLHHTPSLVAFTNPTTNSYHRLIPGFEAPTNLAYSSGNRSACIRIPVTGNNPSAKRVEYRVPDPSCNPYLAFSAQLLAGIDGIINKIEPPAPVDKDIFEMPKRERKLIKQVPGSLESALKGLERDYEYLLRGDVFSKEIIDVWINYKRTQEIDKVRQAPNPYEFVLYYDI